MLIGLRLSRLGLSMCNNVTEYFKNGRQIGKTDYYGNSTKQILNSIESSAESV